MEDRSPNYTKEDYQRIYIESYRKQVDFYYNQSRFYWFLHLFFQVIMLVGASSIPFLLNITEVPKSIPTFISAIVALSTAFVASFRFQKRSENSMLTSADIKRELRLFDIRVGAYKELSSEQAFEHLMNQLDDISKRQYRNAFSFSRAKSGQDE